MTASATLHSIGRDHAVSILETPGDSEAWDRAGQDCIRLQDVPSALSSFKRSEASGPPFLQNYLYRLAMALEISGQFDAAAARYIRVHRQGSEHSRDALYRAICCLNQTKAQNEIAGLLVSLNPAEWREYQHLGLIGGSAMSKLGKPSQAASWLLNDPDISAPDTPARLLLNAMIDGGTSVGSSEDVRRFIFESAHTIFRELPLCRKLLRWILRCGHGETLASIIVDPRIVALSNGANLGFAAIFFRDAGLNDKKTLASRKALVLRPDDPNALRSILPDENGFHTFGANSAILWAKAVIICPETEDFSANEAIIALKIADLEILTTRYLMRAANRFKASPMLLYNVASHLNEKALAEMATPLLRRAILMHPSYAKAWSSLSVSMSVMLDFERGLKASLRALIVDPKLQSGHTNLAMAYRGLGRLDLAIQAGKRQLEISPNDIIARMGVAFNDLCIGAIEEGFEYYRSRWAQKGFPSQKRPFPQKEWTLQKIPKDGKVLIYMEQGMGDEFMFSWFLHYAEECAPGKIIVECDPRLTKIFSRSFPSIEFWPLSSPVQKRLLARDVLYKIPIGHLPSLFTPRIRKLITDRWALAHQKCVAGYGWIIPDFKKVSQWRHKLASMGYGERVCIGISWRSGNITRARESQYLKPEEVVESLPDDSIAVILQYVFEDFELQAIKRAAAERGIDVVRFDGLDLKNNLDDVASLSAALDAIVTPLTSTAFIGGVVGTPTWVFRTATTGNIWQQLGTPRIPWIPSIHLFFRGAHAPWDPTISEMRQALSDARNWLLARRANANIVSGGDTV